MTADQGTLAARSRRLGAAAMLASGLGFGMSGVFTRSIEGDAWQIASWRGLTASPAILAYVWWRQRRGTARVRIRLDPAAGLQGLVLLALNAASMVLLVTSLQKTAVANVSVIIATVPFMAAALGWLMLRERLRRSTVIASAVSFGGVMLTVAGSLGMRDLDGDLLAVALALTLASLIVLIRRFGDTDALIAQAGSGVLLFAVAAAVADPFGIAASEMPLTVAFGLVFAVALVLWTEGIRRIPAAEAGLLATTETPCSILAAWIVVNEAPPLATVAGGLLVLGAVLSHAGADLAHNRVSGPWLRPRAAPGSSCCPAGDGVREGGAGEPGSVGEAPLVCFEFPKTAYNGAVSGLLTARTGIDAGGADPGDPWEYRDGVRVAI